ncbi:MAG: hypothetical protein WC750_00200 [Patescibacteria group bacterium]|jgi:hypothetical protein
MNKLIYALSILSVLFLGCGGDAFTSFPLSEDSGKDAKPDVKLDVEAGQPDVKPEAEASVDAKPDVKPEAGHDAEVQPEVGPDVEPVEADAAEPPPDVIEEPIKDVVVEDKPPVLTDCQTYGVSGKVAIIVRYNLAVSIEAGVKVLAVMGKLTFNNASKNTNFETWCWALPGEKLMVCIPKDGSSLPVDVDPGMIVEFEPGTAAPGVQMTDGDGFCTAQDCPAGDFQVCSGKQKEPICRVQNGNWIPMAEKATGPWNITTIKCPFPQSADQ